MRKPKDIPKESTPVRIDKWLWSSRLYKTRKLAVDALRSGRVEVNGIRAKAARNLSVDDIIRFRKDGLEREIVVRKLAARRQPASIAVTMYEETAESRERREALEEQFRVQARQVSYDRRRPESRARELSRRVKRGD